MAVVVCVTGAGGFIGSWIVKLLLARGYTVRGTSRRADDPKNAHLWALDGAAERLTMVQVDLLDRASLRAAFDGCVGVIHTASPMHDNPEEIIEPIITGSRNVVEVAADAGVRRVVMSSTIGTMYMDPNRDPDAPLDESCWSDLDYCKKTKNWYCYAKTIAERGAWEAARERGLDLAVVIPVVVLGELLQPGMNISTKHILKYLTGEVKTYVNESHAYVHVRDAAEAHVRVLEAPGASGRRYVCAERTLHRGELCRILAELFPQYPIPTRCKDEAISSKGYKFTNQPLKDLGMKFTPVHEYLYEAVKSLQEKGFIQKFSDTKPREDQGPPRAGKREPPQPFPGRSIQEGRRGAQSNTTAAEAVPGVRRRAVSGLGNRGGWDRPRLLPGACQGGPACRGAGWCDVRAGSFPRRSLSACHACHARRDKRA